MSATPRWAHPVLSCAEARTLEARLFGGDETKEWAAMQRAGRAVATAVLDDFREIGGLPLDGRILVLVGKGHNGGDALIATQAILEQFPGASAEIVFSFGHRTLRPLAARAWRELAQAAGKRATARRIVGVGAGEPAISPPVSYALCLDGVFGFQFRPPLPAAVAALLTRVNALSIQLRAAIDLPSGLAEAGATAAAVFRADFTYATGCVKAPLINGGNAAWVGRVRYLDLGFFAQDGGDARLRVLTPAVLAPLTALRSASSDKRSFGHVLILGGSRSYPGAVLMTVLAALRSGAGLVTALVPESLAPAFAARAPEAMWVGWPETAAGGLARAGEHLWRERLERVDAIVIGPGLGRDPETLALVLDVVTASTKPLVLDADALQPEIVRAGTAARVLTPHLGELRRILAGDGFYATAAGRTAVVVVKGRLTCVTQGGRTGYYSPFGGPVLARGGSGDLLAGMIGTQLAQTPDDPVLAASRGVVWHGRAADALARVKGQVAVHTTQLLEYLPAVLRGEGSL
jgi:NAD(P)H-hydrate epimerase